jgi:hypothetical protein
MRFQALSFLLLASAVGVGCTGDILGGGNHDDPMAPDAAVVENPPDASNSGPVMVAMDQLVMQSQVEPYRGDQPSLTGNGSVEEVQRALLALGHAVTVDGWFGNTTADAYAKFQGSLGYTGLDANGIPGQVSLSKLGEGRFDVDHMITVGPRTTYTGKTVNQRTYDMLVAADAIVAHDIILSQGSYNPGAVAASAGTHDGGGAIDLSIAALNDTQRWETVKALRTVGFAAWLRTPAEGDWPYHIHAIAIGDTDLASGARNQVADYFVGKNGLASHAADSTPAAYKADFTWWEKFKGI